ncbi:uncharacterized protein PgNI_09321 [Pyricularia grisea]|uniref:Uncharacterized protein n=1 Tax=Pyricularia grisea TaxID=148305 RepID=A0A6P8ASK5_PYRGI|nr:uncharacterized protein PgNI_09321 [Pyricularia grisea]TLD05104.1 hypothetical protein PgNI_09321 [Pyricularia grisea]
MHFSKFTILLTSASAAIAAPLDLEASTGNALVASNALVARQTAILNLGIIPAISGILGQLLGALSLPTTLANLQSILSQVTSGISLNQVQLLAQTQAVLTGLRRQLTAAEAALLQQVNVALALVGTTPGVLLGTVTGTLQSTINGLPTQIQTAITNAIASVGVPTINAGGGISLASV